MCILAPFINAAVNEARPRRAWLAADRALRAVLRRYPPRVADVLGFFGELVELHGVLTKYLSGQAPLS